VVVPVTDGTLHIEFLDGSTTSAELRAGVAYHRPAGIEHNVVNAGAAPLAFVETEVKAFPRLTMIFMRLDGRMTHCLHLRHRPSRTDPLNIVGGGTR
jgi:mannose-6-phosphate isomerase-like protein (cupin superfamily)